MLLYQDTVVQLNYDPSTDILEVTWPDIAPDALPEVKKSLQATVEKIKDYDVKKLLIDSSKSTISIPYEENSELALQLAVDMNTTRLQKIARIESKDHYRESMASEDLQKIQATLDVRFKMKNFADKASALAWLKAAS